MCTHTMALWCDCEDSFPCQYGVPCGLEWLVAVVKVLIESLQVRVPSLPCIGDFLSLLGVDSVVPKKMSRKAFSLEIVHTASFSGDVKPGTGHSLAIPVASLVTTMDEMAEAVRRNRQLKTLTTRHSELTTP